MAVVLETQIGCLGLPVDENEIVNLEEIRLLGELKKRLGGAGGHGRGGKK